MAFVKGVSWRRNAVLAFAIGVVLLCHPERGRFVADEARLLRPGCRLGRAALDDPAKDLRFFLWSSLFVVILSAAKNLSPVFRLLLLPCRGTARRARPFFQERGTIGLQTCDMALQTM